MTSIDDGGISAGSNWPLAYFLTWTCYGTRLHGDERGTVDRRHRGFGAPPVDPSPGRQFAARQRMAGQPVTLDAPSRAVVDREIRSVVERRGWILLALNVRTNHVHVVVSAPTRPELALEAFKAFATRGLGAAGFLPAGGRVWTRHGSTRYLWSERDVEMAVAYTVEAQGPSLE